MANLAVGGSASRFFHVFHEREIRRTAQQTLDDIATRFPMHLIDDVNARGLPPDRTLIVSDTKTPRRSFKNFDGKYKFYSLD
jgi:hypothetical protein